MHPFMTHTAGISGSRSKKRGNAETNPENSAKKQKAVSDEVFRNPLTVKPINSRAKIVLCYAPPTGRQLSGQPVGIGGHTLTRVKRVILLSKLLRRGA